jgi:hypothetical protein
MKRKQTLECQQRGKGERIPSIVALAAPPPKFKIPSRLHSKIREATEPVVGLGEFHSSWPQLGFSWFFMQINFPC